jgi:hypothetical protein
MLHHPRSPLFIASFLSLALLLTSLRSAAQTSEPDHLIWAEDVASNVAPDQNVYESGVRILEWAGVDGATDYVNRTDCASFLTAVMKQSYGLTGDDIDAWIGWANPNSAMYHDAVVAEMGFEVVPTVLDIEAGDIIAIKYLAGTGASGHLMIAAGPAILRAPTAPLYAGTLQFEITVIDSSSSIHGNADTRKQANGTTITGVGMGVFRIYTDLEGTTLGHTWSTQASSTYRSQATRPMAFGRVTGEFLPLPPI